jgi:hypothetical protein
VDAVIACTPVTSLFAGLGLAGGGYLVGREGVAACGAVVSAFGLLVERMQTRSVRIRLRRERSRHRSDLRQVGRDLRDLQRQLTSIRTDLDGVRDERDAVRTELRAVLGDLSAARPSVVTAAPVAAAMSPVQAAEAPVAEASDGETSDSEAPVIGEPVTRPTLLIQEVAAASRLGLLVPGQLRSPIATGGIPVLDPGPSEPVTVIDLRTRGTSSASSAAGALDLELVDDLVYAALADADADELTRTLEQNGRRAGRHAEDLGGVLHAGDAHHAGDYARDDDTVPGGVPVLYVVRHGRHVA